MDIQIKIVIKILIKPHKIQTIIRQLQHNKIIQTTRNMNQRVDIKINLCKMIAMSED
jgi:hypothetical protein